MKKTFFLALVMILGLIAPSGVMATPITLGASSGNLAASATFDVSGTNLIVTLTNTSAFNVAAPADVLTAVFFTLAGDPTLTRVSAVLAPGSTVFFGPTGPGGSLGSEWAYKDGLSGAPQGADEGISAVGFSLFGPPNVFPGGNIGGQNNPPGGLDYGILSVGDDTTIGNAPVTGGNPLVKNSVIFTLSGISAGFDPSALDAITDVSFQYGTSLSEPNLAVPEPATMFLLGSGLIGVGAFVRRKFRK